MSTYTLLRMIDLAARWKCSRDTVAKIVCQPRFPRPVEVGSLRRWRVEDVKKWEARR